MNRLIVAIVLGLLAIGGCILGSIIVNGGVKEISGHVELALKACDRDDMESAEKYINKAIEKWNRSRNSFELFIGSDTIHMVEHNMVRLPDLLKHKDKEWFVLECEETLLNLEHMAYAESFSLHNIV